MWILLEIVRHECVSLKVSGPMEGEGRRKLRQYLEMECKALFPCGAWHMGAQQAKHH